MAKFLEKSQIFGPKMAKNYDFVEVCGQIWPNVDQKKIGVDGWIFPHHSAKLRIVAEFFDDSTNVFFKKSVRQSTLLKFL